MKKSIDAVITWVDGSDETHKNRRLKAMNSISSKKLGYIPSGYKEIRFNNNNEIKYCFYSIRKFMPWIRKIFLVTDGQCPSFLTQESRKNLNVEIIDHSVIFRDYESALPTFNSRSIESAIHRIPDLSDRYIYFNDDVMAINHISEEDFFIGPKVVLRGTWMPFKNYGLYRTLLSGIMNKIYEKLSLRERPMHLLAQYRAAALAGLRGTYFEAAHAPHPVNTETLKSYFKKNPEIFRKNIQPKFRHLNQFVTHPLANSLEIKERNYVICQDNDYYCMGFSNVDEDDQKNQVNNLINGSYKFLCLQSIEYAAPDVMSNVLDFLNKKILS